MKRTYYYNCLLFFCYTCYRIFNVDNLVIIGNAFENADKFLYLSQSNDLSQIWINICYDGYREILCKFG